MVTTYFDAAGRPLSDSAGSGNTYGSNGNGQITSTPANTTTSTAGETLKYDDLGRLSEVDIAAYSNKPSSTETYAYDPLGRLQTVSNGVTTRFIYVGLTNSVAEEVDGAGNVLSKHATDLFGTELFDFTGIAGTTVSYLGRNAHGDVTYTYNGAGTVTSTGAYDPFGNVIATSGSRPSITDSGWQGSWFDAQTRLYYVVARWYSPALGQFLSDDPLDHSPADPQGRDPYAYGAGDPVDQSDPSGLSSSRLFYFQFWSQNTVNPNDPQRSWGNRQLVTPARQAKLSAAGKAPCMDSFSKSGCAITSLAMVLDYLDRPIEIYDAAGKDTGVKDLPTPLTLDYWLNAQTTGNNNANLLGAQSCGINLVSGAMNGRLHITTKKLKTHIPYAWNQTKGKGNVFNAVAGAIREFHPVIAMVPGVPNYHFVVITGWETWAFTGKGQWGNRELDSEVFVPAKRGGRASHHDGVLGDFIINDPAVSGPGTHLFKTYNQIDALYVVQKA